MSVYADAVRRPFLSPYEWQFRAWNDGDKYVFIPRKASRLAMPADYATSKLLMWNQQTLRDTGWSSNNPWKHNNSAEGYSKIVATTLINAGSSVDLKRASDYGGAYASISPTYKFGATAWVWSHDKANHKYSYEFYLDNDLEETSPSVEYDDDEGFWNVVSSLTVAEETTIKTKGTSSAKITWGDAGWAYFAHQYASAQDWSAKEFVCFYYYGCNSGKPFRVVIGFDQAAGTYTNWAGYAITDNFTGWKRFVVPFKKMNVAGTASWTTVWKLRFDNNGTNRNGDTSYLDRTLVDVGQWVKIEAYVPDNLKLVNGVGSVFLYSWDQQGSAWLACFAQLYVSAGQFRNYSYSGSLKFLDGTLQSDIGTFLKPSPNNRFGIAIYDPMLRTETENTGQNDYCDPSAGSFTYSSYYGCLKRIGFAIKMPPDDGQDSSTTGISQAKLKLEVYYSTTNDITTGYLDRYGLTTYEFENSTNQYYGLQNLNNSWLTLFDATSKTIEYLVLSRRPTGLKIRADENEDIDTIELTLPKGTVIHAGSLSHGDLTRDSDSDGIPDFLEENLEAAIPSLVKKRDYKGWP